MAGDNWARDFRLAGQKMLALYGHDLWHVQKYWAPCGLEEAVMRIRCTKAEFERWLDSRSFRAP